MPRRHEGASHEEERTQSDSEHQARVETRRRKTAAIESLAPSGDLAEDASALFVAMEFQPNQIQEPYAEAFSTGNEPLIVEYFRALSITIQNDPSSREDIQAYNRALKQFIAGMLQAHEERLTRQTNGDV